MNWLWIIPVIVLVVLLVLVLFAAKNSGHWSQVEQQESDLKKYGRK